MIEPKAIKAKIDEILTLCRADNDATKKFGSAEHKAADLKYWEAITALDKEAVQGLYADKGVMPGRLLRFGVADGYAYYIVLRVNKKTCKLVHLPYGDGYRFQGVGDDGEVLRDVVEDNLAWADVLAEAFKKAKTMKPTDAYLGPVIDVEHPRLPVVEAEID
jgi:hypothetical protein